MSDITFRIDSEDAEAFRAFQRLTTAERLLTLETKKGNVAAGEKNRTEAQAARAMEKAAQAAERKAAAEARATAASREAARASLARQKSMALQASMERQQASQRRMAAGWEQAAARAQLQVDERNHKRALDRAQGLTRATEKQRGALTRGIVASGKFATSLVGIGTAAAASAVLIRGLTAAHEHAMDAARRSDEAARGLKALVALQKPGAAGQQHVRDVVLQGAKAGVGAEEAAGMAQPIQSLTDVNADGVLDEAEKARFSEAYGAALKLRQTGVSAEDAQTVITQGLARKQTGSMSADKLTAAADASKFDPGAFARSAPAMMEFEDSDTALAAVTALSTEVTAEQAPTLVRGAALTLNRASDESEFSKKFGLAGLSEADKIRALQAYAVRHGDQGVSEDERIAAFSRTFKNEGLDEEKARAVGILVRQGATFERALGSLAAVEGTGAVVAGKVGQLADDPLTGSAMRADEAKAGAQADKLYGVEADKNRDARARALARGAQLQRFGGSQAVDPETGEEKGFGWDLIAGRAKAKWNGMPGGLGGPWGWGGDARPGDELAAEQLGLLQQSQAVGGLSGGAQPLAYRGPAMGEGDFVDGVYRGSGVSSGEFTGGGAMTEESAQALRRALEENTEATRGNTETAGAGGGRAPVGGAKANAEERY